MDLATGAKWFLKSVNSLSLRLYLAPRKEDVGKGTTCDSFGV